MKPIEQPLNRVFEFESTYCLCVKGIPNRPDNTVIEGLGQVPSIEVPVDAFYQSLESQETARITEPSLGLFPICLLFLAMAIVKHDS